MNKTPTPDMKPPYERPAELEAPLLVMNDRHRQKFESAMDLLTKRFTDPKRSVGFPNNDEELAKLKQELYWPLAYFLLQEELHPQFNFTKNRGFVRKFVKDAEDCIASFQEIPRPTKVEVSKRIPFSYDHFPLKAVEESIEALQTFLTAGKRFTSEPIASGQQRRPYVEMTIVELAVVFERWTGEEFIPSKETAKGSNGREFVNKGPLFIQLVLDFLKAEVTLKNIGSVLAHFAKIRAKYRP